MIPIEPGRVVLSKAGRDTGRRFVVLAADDTYAAIADGDLRKAEKPKKKKLRHVRATQGFFPSIAGILEGGGLPTNAEIRGCLSEQSAERREAEGL